MIYSSPDFCFQLTFQFLEESIENYHFWLENQHLLQILLLNSSSFMLSFDMLYWLYFLTIRQEFLAFYLFLVSLELGSVLVLKFQVLLDIGVDFLQLSLDVIPFALVEVYFHF